MEGEDRGPYGPRRIHGHYDYRRPSGEMPVPRHLRGWEKYQAIGRPMTIEQYREVNSMNFDPNLSAFHHALATGQHAAGHVSAEEAEKAEREMHAQAYDLEVKAKADAEKQAEIDRRLKGARESGETTTDTTAE